MSNTKLFEQALLNSILGYHKEVLTICATEQQAKNMVANVLLGHLNNFGYGNVGLQDIQAEIDLLLKEYKVSEDEQKKMKINQDVIALKEALDILKLRRVKQWR